MKWTGLLSLVGAAVFTVACGDGRDGDSTADRTGGPAAVGTTGEARVDAPAAAADSRANDVQQFVNDVAMAGNAEVELGRLAGERAVNHEVKQFAQMMVKDHAAGGAALKQAVSPHGVEVPATIDDKHQELLVKLRGTSGAEFDREYMAAMVEGHEAVKSLVDGRAHRTTTATGAAADRNQQLESAVNQWAAKALPTVEQHLKHAKELNDRVSN